MTKEDSYVLVKYALNNYPSTKMSEEAIMQTAAIWQREFSSKTKEQVIEGFRLARLESPDWFPPIPKILAAIRLIETKAQRKSPEAEFRDSHCGKSQEEWNQMKDWESSKEGAEKIRQYKKRLFELIGG